MDAGGAEQAISKCGGEREVSESDGSFKARGFGAGSNDGQSHYGLKKLQCPRRECCGCAGGVCGGCGNRSNIFYAEGCTVRKLLWKRDVWRKRDAGGWVDFRLRRMVAERKEREGGSIFRR